MQVIKMGSATFKVSENSDTLAKLQKCIDGQKKKQKRPTIKKDRIRDYPLIENCTSTADYVRQYYALNQGIYFPHSNSRATEINSLFPNFFQPMRETPIPRNFGIDGIEEPSE